MSVKQEELLDPGVTCRELAERDNTVWGASPALSLMQQDIQSKLALFFFFFSFPGDARPIKAPLDTRLEKSKQFRPAQLLIKVIKTQQKKSFMYGRGKKGSHLILW